VSADAGADPNTAAAAAAAQAHLRICFSPDSVKAELIKPDGECTRFAKATAACDHIRGIGLSPTPPAANALWDAPMSSERVK
jgi:hypothetical protein